MSSISTVRITRSLRTLSNILTRTLKHVEWNDIIIAYKRKWVLWTLFILLILKDEPALRRYSGAKPLRHLYTSVNFCRSLRDWRQGQEITLLRSLFSTFFPFYFSSHSLLSYPTLQYNTFYISYPILRLLLLLSLILFLPFSLRFFSFPPTLPTLHGFLPAS